MKKLFLLFTLFIVTTLCLPTAFAQYEPSMQMGLPEGAIARLGKGNIQEIMYSPDGTRLAVATTIGVWIYDSRTGEELDLINTEGHGTYANGRLPVVGTLGCGSGLVRLRVAHRTDSATLSAHGHTIEDV